MANDDEMKTFDSCHWEFVWEKRSTNRRENLYNDLLLNGIVFYHWQWRWRLTRERSIKWREKSNCKLWIGFVRMRKRRCRLDDLWFEGQLFSLSDVWKVLKAKRRKRSAREQRINFQIDRRTFVENLQTFLRWTFSSLLQLNSYLHKYRWKEPQMTHKIVKIIWVKSKVKWKFCWVSEIEDHLCRV